MGRFRKNGETQIVSGRFEGGVGNWWPNGLTLLSAMLTLETQGSLVFYLHEHSTSVRFHITIRLEIELKVALRSRYHRHHSVDRNMGAP